MRLSGAGGGSGERKYYPRVLMVGVQEMERRKEKEINKERGRGVKGIRQTNERKIRTNDSDGVRCVQRIGSKRIWWMLPGCLDTGGQAREGVELAPGDLGATWCSALSLLHC
jgi:hypothetical protein